jgi:hypothetical protein
MARITGVSLPILFGPVLEVHQYQNPEVAEPVDAYV